MKTLYFDCPMGAAGDMLMSALIELHPDPAGFVSHMNKIGFNGIIIKSERTTSYGISGTRTRVMIDGHEEGSHSHHHSSSHEHHHEHRHEHEHEHNYHHHHHPHRTLNDIEAVIRALDIPDKVKTDAMNVYRMIADAESVVHGKEVVDIHFHEVGRRDAIADIVGVCSLIHELSPDVIISSPVCVGFGTVSTAHGILSVPAPATARILKDVPVYSGSIEGELCTPTGAALLKYFANKFIRMPLMSIEKTGYGIGSRKYEQAPNCVRAILGESDGSEGGILDICCNLDDMTAEAVGYATKAILDGGALDVFTIPVGMKKDRPGVLLSVLCKAQDKDKILRLVFKHTSTIGVREYSCKRYTLDRTERVIQTKYGPVREKISSGYGITKIKPEYEDIARIAKENNISVSEAVDLYRNDK